ncbi:MAG: tRNA (adenosine(37)-N6)-threonylcarbamoyltransferase complex transferase subunit TsaD [Pseudomonadota bacterium]
MTAFDENPRAANGNFRLLGLETSCDDTAAAVLEVTVDDGYLIETRVLSNEVWTQHDAHAAYGGVVPEIAARSHVERVDVVAARAMSAAGVGFGDLDAVAATAGPGLVGGVMVGLTAAKAIALSHGLPLIPVNHLEGHALSARLTEATPFPYLLLLISGGHTQLIAVEALGRYRRLGTTIDDAAGEAFDKTAKLLGLGQPGGPRIESAAVGGRASRFDLPKPLQRRPGCDFSFSGLKTAVRLLAEEHADKKGEIDGQTVADIAASFQDAVAAHLAARTQRAIKALSTDSRYGQLIVAGGVAANCAVRGALDVVCGEANWRLVAPPSRFCTDNGAMIALAGAERLAAGMTPGRREALGFAPRARWPLAPPVAGREHGGGRKGPKA